MVERAGLAACLPGWGGRQDLGQEGHAVHGPHGDVEWAGYIHGHGRCYGNWVGDIHGCCGGDVDGGDVDGPGDGDRVLEAHWGRDVDSVGGNVHLRSDGDGGVVEATSVHRCGVGDRNGHRCRRGRVADLVAIWGKTKQERSELQRGKGNHAVEGAAG